MTEKELLSIATATFDDYQKDPVHTWQELLSEYGQDDATRIVYWIDAMHPRLFGAADLGAVA